jgi:hypothetical protein
LHINQTRIEKNGLGNSLSLFDLLIALPRRDLSDSRQCPAKSLVLPKPLPHPPYTVADGCRISAKMRRNHLALIATQSPHHISSNGPTPQSWMPNPVHTFPKIANS